MVLGEWAQDGTGKWAMVPKDQSALDSLVKAGGLSNSEDVEVFPYSMNLDMRRYGQGTLMIELSDKPVVYAEMIPVKFEEN